MEMTVTAVARPTRTPVIALLGPNAVSLAGNVLAALAIPWFVLETTGSAARTGLVGFFTIVPTVLAAFFGGGLVDRLGARRTSILADLLSGVTVALVPLLHQTVGLPFAGLLGLVFLGALFDAPGGTARTVLFPDVVERAGMRLERGNATYQAIQRFSQLLGPVLAGLLIAGFGASNALWVDAASFAVSAGLVAMAVPARVSTGPAQVRGRYLDEIRAGWSFLRSDRLVRTLVGAIAVTNLLDAAVTAVVLPVYVRDAYGSARALGLVFAAFGAGAVASSLAFGAVGHRLPRRTTFVLAFVAVGLPLWVLVAMPPLAVVVASRVVVGLAAGPINPILMTVLQERVPTELRGRVFGTLTAAVLVAAPAGVILAGYVIEGVGLQAVLAVIAAGYVVTTGSLWFNPAVREMDAPRPAREPRRESVACP